VRDDVLRVAAVHGVAGEFRTVAEILRPGAAVLAGFIGLVKPGDADASTDGKAPRILTLLLDNPHDLVTRNHRRLARRQFAFDYMQIGAAHTASMHTRKHFVVARLRHGRIREFEWIRFYLGWRMEQTGFHLSLRISESAWNQV
jgi:hypothetical protein